MSTNLKPVQSILKKNATGNNYQHIAAGNLKYFSSDETAKLTNNNTAKNRRSIDENSEMDVLIAKIPSLGKFLESPNSTDFDIIIDAVQEYNVQHLRTRKAALIESESAASAFGKLIDLLKLRKCFCEHILPSINAYTNWVSPNALKSGSRTKIELEKTIQVVDQLVIAVRQLLHPGLNLSPRHRQELYRIEVGINLSLKNEVTTSHALSSLQILQDDLYELTEIDQGKLTIDSVTDVDGNDVPMAMNREDLAGHHKMTHWVMERPWTAIVNSFRENLSKLQGDKKLDKDFINEQTYQGRMLFFEKTLYEVFDDAVAEILPIAEKLGEKFEALPDEFEKELTAIIEAKLEEINSQFKNVVNVEFTQPAEEDFQQTKEIDVREHLWKGKPSLFSELSRKIADCLQRTLTKKLLVQNKCLGTFLILQRTIALLEKKDSLKCIKAALKDEIDVLKGMIGGNTLQEHPHQTVEMLKKIGYTLKDYVSLQNKISTRNKIRAEVFKELHPLLSNILAFINSSLKSASSPSLGAKDVLKITNLFNPLSQIIETCFSKRLKESDQNDIIELYNAIGQAEEIAEQNLECMVKKAAAEIFEDIVDDKKAIPTEDAIKNSMISAIENLSLSSLKMPGSFSLDAFENFLYSKLKQELSIVTQGGILSLKSAEKIEANVITLFTSEKWKIWLETNLPNSVYSKNPIDAPWRKM